MADAEAFVTDQDVGARNPDGWQGTLIASIALIWTFLQVFNASPVPAKIAQSTGQNWIYIPSDVSRIIHLVFGWTLATLAFPLFKKSSRSQIPGYDWVLVVGGIIATLYIVANSAAIADRSGLPTTADLIASAVGISIVLIATFRALGLPMVMV
ncbi:MAG: C4-dicarboxylate ABC transporter, partial [Paracoccaceae bacterium]